MSVTTIIPFPVPGPLLSMNDRLHWSVTRRRSKYWLDAAYYAALEHVRPPRRQGTSLIQVTLPVKGRRRRDPHNFMPTVKPIVDGLVHAGLWPDDTPEFVTVAEPRLLVGGTQVEVELIPWEH